MSNQDNRGASKERVTGETATPDRGGAFGGSAGAIESRGEREDDGDQSGGGAAPPRADALSHPPANVQGGASEPLTYSPSAGTGMQGAPMSQADACDASTANTDKRREAGNEGREMGKNYTGEAASDREASRATPPERGSGQESDAF